MGKSARTPGRIIVITKLPQSHVPRYILSARSIVERTAVSPWSASPLPRLPLVRAAIDALEEADTATLTRAKGSKDVRDEKRSALHTRLEELRAHVESVDNCHPEEATSIAESVGISEKAAGGVVAVRGCERGARRSS